MEHERVVERGGLTVCDTANQERPLGNLALKKTPVITATAHDSTAALQVATPKT
jgi:CheY-like chemotaxis protein